MRTKKKKKNVLQILRNMTRNYLNDNYNATILYVQQISTHGKNVLWLSYCKICKRFTIFMSIPEIVTKKNKKTIKAVMEQRHQGQVSVAQQKSGMLKRSVLK